LRKILISGSILIGLFLIYLLFTVLLSPYGNHKGFNYKVIQSSILIKAPTSKVYSYLGDSENAQDWSVYVDHISPLNGDLIDDGKQGSIRRCFVNKDEEGRRWDEEVLAIEPNKLRRLSCYGYHNFEISAGTLHTEQIFEQSEDGGCLLSLTLFLPPGESTLLRHLKMYWAANEVAEIFDENLKNIKKLNEGKSELQFP
jgi:uncharacterized protein YndB with AHSA1/START domain